MRRLLGFCFVVGGLLSASFGGLEGADATVAKLLSTLGRFYGETPGVVADYEQILNSRSLPHPQEERGTVFLKPPGKMRWEYSSPAGKLAVTDGDRAFLYLPEDHQVLVGRLKDLDSGAVASRLLLGDRSIENDFEIEALPVEKAPGSWRLRLLPRDPGFPYDAVDVVLEEKTGIVRYIELLDPLGNRVVYRFENVRGQETLEDRLFAFQVPPGVDVQQIGEGSGAPPTGP